MSEYDVFDVACLSCGESTFGVLLKPDSFNRIICPKCKIPSYVYVSNNLDILTFNDDELCKTCNGSGKCKTCMGSLEEVCPRCDGIGFYFEDGGYHGCVKCGGSKTEYTVQDIIKGRGKVTCTNCSGMGICDVCKGMRFISKK